MQNNQRGIKIGIALYHTDPNNIKGLTVYALSLLDSFKKVDDKNIYSLLVRKEHQEYFSKYSSSNFKIIPVNSLDRRPLLNKIAIFLETYVFSLPFLQFTYVYADKILNRSLIKEIESLSLDLIYFPSGATYPIGIETPVVVSIHDIQYAHLPHFFSFFTRQSRKTAHTHTVNRAQYVQASSEFVREDFIRYFKASSDKIVLIRDGVDSVFNSKPLDQDAAIKLRAKYRLPEKFIFYPAQHWPHKNHITIIKALAHLKSKYDLRVPLVLTGSLKTKLVDLETEVKQNRVADQVFFVGNIPFEDLIILYKIATIVCIPSLHESNSLPLIEALKSGTATLAANIEPNTEINKNNAITIFNRLDYNDLALKMKELFENEELRKNKIKDGFDIVSDCSWENTAQNYINLFEKMKNE